MKSTWHVYMLKSNKNIRFFYARGQNKGYYFWKIFPREIFKTITPLEISSSNLNYEKYILIKIWLLHDFLLYP